MVIYKVAKNTVEVMDPGIGEMVIYNFEDFLKIWSGVFILIEPSESFKPENNQTTVAQRFKDLLIPHKKVLIQALFGAILYTLLGLSTSIYIEKNNRLRIGWGKYKAFKFVESHYDPGFSVAKHL